MTPGALALVLTSAAIHATWNLWLKQIGPRARIAALLWIMTTISACCYAPLALWQLAQGGWQVTPGALGWIAGSALIHVAYFVLLIRGYRVGDLSLVYPVARGTGPLLAFVGAIVLFREPPTALAIAGALLIAIGVFTLAARGTLGAPLAPGLRYGLATGTLIAVYTLWDGWAVKRAGIPPLVFYWGGEVVRAAVFIPSALSGREAVADVWRTQRARVIGVALLSPLSYILILIAMRGGNVSHIAPAREISILIGAYLGGLVLGERERTRRLVAAAAFAAGVIALALA